MRRGRKNLYEELGRVEGERSNKNRRAEISRVHGELNRGYKGGGRIGLKSGKSPKHGTGPKWPKPKPYRPKPPRKHWKRIPPGIEGIFGLGEKGKPHSTKEGKEATMKLARERLRSKKSVGGIAKILGKKAVDWIKKNRKTIKKEIYSPEGKKKTKDMLDKLKKKYPDSQMFGPGKAKGGRIGLKGGSSAQSHYLQHGYGPTKIQLRSGKPKLAKKGW